MDTGSFIRDGQRVRLGLLEGTVRRSAHRFTEPWMAEKIRWMVEIDGTMLPLDVLIKTGLLEAE